MKKFLMTLIAGFMMMSGAHAQDLKMATLPANLSQAIVMATFANVVSSEIPGVNIEVAAGGAATAHMLEVGKGNLDMSMTSPVVYNLMAGQKAMYAKNPQAPELAKKVRLLMWYPYGQYHFIVRADSDIRTLDDLEGASVFLGPTGGGAWNAAYGFVKAATGLDAKTGDYEAIDANWTTGFQAFLDGTVDVYVNGCIDPCGSILQISETTPIRFIGASDGNTEAVKKFLGAHRFLDEVPAGLYKNQKNTGPVTSFNTSVGIAVNSDVPDETVYQITRAFWSNLDRVTSTAPWAKALDVQFAAKKRGLMELHPGAARYYKEAGAL